MAIKSKRKRAKAGSEEDFERRWERWEKVNAEEEGRVIEAPGEESYEQAMERVFWEEVLDRDDYRDAFDEGPRWDFGASKEPERTFLEDIKIKAGWALALRDEADEIEGRRREREERG